MQELGYRRRIPFQVPWSKSIVKCGFASNFHKWSFYLQLINSCYSGWTSICHHSVIVSRCGVANNHLETNPLWPMAWDLRKTVWFFLCCTCCAGLVIPPVTIRRHLRPGLASNLWIWSPIQSLMMLWMYWVCPTNSGCFQEGNPADGVFLMGKPHAATPIEAK